MAVRFQVVDRLARIDRTHAWEELQGAERGKRVARVVGPAQQRHEVLDVPRFEELQSSEFHEGNLPPGQLHFERVTVARGAEQYRLALQRHVGFAAPQNLSADVLGLRLDFVDSDDPGASAFATD